VIKVFDFKRKGKIYARCLAYNCGATDGLGEVEQVETYCTTCPYIKWEMGD
jgi:hypothetical protein